ncbi:DUF2147 domain-containing protein [Myroides odoratus]|uniref:Uncharacterized protein conserved in bacteria n=1 Tax=Myroides odoratus TaxID=256 RepID=A0A378RQ65_MYROD|nr:DUF2147 domain-containing protein [Myroides odoratus]MCS4240272.1 uncharacterized protein (DUF2147 family) [Myroides odoratus]QQU04151.1 DUF2147 domain-containing protein [Myroides odoratus]STZ28451.1 Uncharacterized protein conserved in bacteria [Myroides odoratus]
MKKLMYAMLFLLGGLLNMNAQTEYSIVGKWKAVDSNGKDKAIVEIKESQGVYTGRIISILDPDDKGKKCEKCPGGDVARTYDGLTIIKNMKKEERNKYSGGTILDPETGKEYSCSIKLVGYSKIEVTGTAQIYLLGKTTTWTKSS